MTATAVDTGMTTPDHTILDVEAILNDLYASEISASISWIWDSGFQHDAREAAGPDDSHLRQAVRPGTGQVRGLTL
jgi:hypothetical protein